MMNELNFSKSLWLGGGRTFFCNLLDSNAVRQKKDFFCFKILDTTAKLAKLGISRAKTVAISLQNKNTKLGFKSGEGRVKTRQRELGYCSDRVVNILNTNTRSLIQKEVIPSQGVGYRLATLLSLHYRSASILDIYTPMYPV